MTEEQHFANQPASRGVARRNFIRTAAATAVALPAVAAMTSGTASAGVISNPLLMYRAALQPYRCYDSRWGNTSGGGSNPTLGRLSTGQTREIAVWNEFSTEAGNGVYEGSPLPASVDILAVTFNLTVVSTLSTGYLMVGPGGSVPTSSHINWFGANQILANAGTMRIYPGDIGDVQTIEVRAGGPAGSSTHFVIDITGWYIDDSGPIII